MSSVMVVDYGAGNLRSMARALTHVAPKGMEVIVSADPEDLRRASHMVLPGVGAFADCIHGLQSLPGMVEALEQEVLERQKPFLGVCVGMQLLAKFGLEHGMHPGLGWLESQVVHIPRARPDLKIPHMGWNRLQIEQPHPVLEGIQQGDYAYFVHSYAMQATDRSPTPPWMFATTEYGTPLAAIVGRQSMLGTQFHPEKSQKTGLRFLENFLRWRP